MRANLHPAQEEMRDSAKHHEASRGHRAEGKVSHLSVINHCLYPWDHADLFVPLRELGTLYKNKNVVH